jgi:hypothetical protein
MHYASDTLRWVVREGGREGGGGREGVWGRTMIVLKA